MMTCKKNNLESPEERLCTVIFSLKTGHLLDWPKLSVALCSSSALRSGFDSGVLLPLLTSHEQVQRMPWRARFLLPSATSGFGSTETRFKLKQ